MGKKLEKSLIDARENPGQFVFHASDEYHHSEWLRIKVGTDVLRLIEEVKSCGKFPYRTESDVLRDAIFHRLAWLEMNYDPKWGESVRAMKRMHLLNAFAAEQANSSKWLEDLERNMNSPKITEKKRLILVGDMYDTLMAMSSDNEDKEIWLKALRDRYPKYVPKGFSFNRRTD